jgi:uncharacterized protein YjiS (DUF1127 family)
MAHAICRLVDFFLKLIILLCINRLAALQQFYCIASKEPHISPVIPAECRRERTKPMLSPVIRFFQSWKRYGLAMQELSQLSDRELADIGITRSDIPRIAWEQSHQA